MLLKAVLTMAIALALTVFAPQRALAQSCSATSFPYTLINGATADASQVMANLNCAPIYGLANWSGNVGINTIDPIQKLEVDGSYYSAPTTSGNASDGTLRIAASGHGEVLDAGITIGAPWLQARLLTNYATNYNLLLNPNGGNVGIGTTAPGANLDVWGSIRSSVASGGTTGGFANAAGGVNQSDFSSDSTASNTYIDYRNNLYLRDSANSFAARIGINGSGNVGIATTSPSYPFYVNGQAAGTTSWLNTSDVRLKKNVVEITGALALVQRLRGVRFDWKTAKERAVGKTLRLPQGEREMGFIAQEVAKIVPEAVAKPKTGKERLYGVKEADLVPLLVEAIKEQQQEIGKLQATVAALQQTVSKQSH